MAIIRLERRKKGLIHACRFVRFNFRVLLDRISSGTGDNRRVEDYLNVHGKVGNPRTVGAWFSGFSNGRKSNTTIDKEIFEGNVNKLEKFCYDQKNFGVPVMQAIEQALAK